MDSFNKDGLLSRLEMLIFNIRKYTGSEIHHVCNMRNTATLLLEAIKRGIIEEEKAKLLVKRLEDQQYEFFKTQFWD